MQPKFGRTSTKVWLLAPLLVAALFAAACGGASESGSSSNVTLDREEEADDLGRLEPQPLAEPATVKVVRSGLYEYFAPLELAQATGEFEKENIQIDFMTATPSDGLVMLAAGQADVLASSLSAGTINAMVDSNIRMVAMGFSSSPESQAGMWVRSEVFVDPATGEIDLTRMKGAKIGSATGVGSPTSLPISAALGKAGLSITDIEFVKLSSTDLIVALENGAIDAAWLSDPLWTQAVDNPDLTFAFNDAGLAITGYLFGESLLDERREVGEAFVRALARASELYLQGDYHADEEVAAALAEALDVPLDILRRSPSNVFDPKLTLREDLAQQVQEIYLLTPDTLASPEPLPADRIFDRDFLEVVLG